MHCLKYLSLYDTLLTVNIIRFEQIFSRRDAYVRE